MKHTYRATWAVLCAAAAFHAACGSEGSKNGDDPDGGSDGAAGTGGDEGDGGDGSGGRSGTGGANGAGGANGTGGWNPDGGTGGTAPGPMCTPRDELPDRVFSSAEAAPSCSLSSACGGDVDGTTWQYLDACVDQDVAFAEMYEACPTAQLNGISDIDVSGTLRFEDGVATHQATITATGVFQAPVECHDLNCKDFQEVTLYNLGLWTAFCYEEPYPDLSCRCLVDFEVSVDESEPYEIADGTITLSGGRTYDYCVSDGGLSIAARSGASDAPFSVELAPPEAFHTPEICDGLDNDGDGEVDDSPVDCPSECDTLGVCAGVVRQCSTGAWRCVYPDTHEPGEETTCDGLDNDCDGEVDEGLVGCVEVCDGLDNDNNGTVDDNLTDESDACPTARGVCASGVTATCNGAAGWECDYTSPAYRAVETQCDGLDNDCDGIVDEGCACVTGQSKLFVLRMGATNAGIVRANLNGSNPELIVPITQFYVFDLAIDPGAGKLYYYDFGTEEIRRVNLDGSGNEPVWSGKTQQWAIDPGSPQRGFAENNISQIRTFTFAAPTVNTTIVPVASVAAMAVDPFHRQLYWSDHSGSTEARIMCANYDGSNPRPGLHTGTYHPPSIEVDGLRGHVYYTSGLGVHRGNVGTDETEVILPVSAQNAAPSDVALDLAGGKLYVTEENADLVRRANLDGSNPEPLLSGADAEGVNSIVLYICAP